jgi:hypothetical protein
MAYGKPHTYKVQLDAALEKIDELKANAICDRNLKNAAAEEITQLNAVLDRAVIDMERIADIKWGYDGDCGTNNIAEYFIEFAEYARNRGEK